MRTPRAPPTRAAPAGLLDSTVSIWTEPGRRAVEAANAGLSAEQQQSVAKRAMGKAALASVISAAAGVVTGGVTYGLKDTIIRNGEVVARGVGKGTQYLVNIGLSNLSERTIKTEPQGK